MELVNDPQSLIPPVVVTMVGNGTGDGNKGAPLTTGTEGKTPDHQPNIVLNIIPPMTAVLVRGFNMFMTVFLALTGLGNLAHAAIGGEALPQINFRTATTFAGLAALGEMGKSVLTITTGLEKKYPLGTGSI